MILPDESEMLSKSESKDKTQNVSKPENRPMENSSIDDDFNLESSNFSGQMQQQESP